jgi:hypothetical protein
MEQKVYLTGRNGQVTEGQISIQSWTETERAKRAFKFGTLTWLLAIACILLPIVHFILVPLLLIAGPIVAIWNYNRKSIIKGGSGPCPFCEKDVSIGRGPDVWPIDELCTKCQNNFSVTKANG